MVNYGEDGNCFLVTLRGSLVGQALGLLPNGHQFESPQSHWRFTWSLTSGPHGISRGARKLARTPMDIKNKKNCFLALSRLRPNRYYFRLVELRM
ncbi:hypothetical protein I3842_09G170300 [Carya illinoinensis]|uniref:Uncharacterized protein n=1 Tax=Carya illinoinensis TaxID=32201 RepID=A0A922E7Y6_CARIL|nr:hypothetical protein I3842_09G170300 [Carya illinoinensis]